jgi:hypothetical protein
MPDGIHDDRLTEEQRKVLRKKNANSTVSVSDGTVYLGIGGGFVSSGNNILARINADKQRAEITSIEKQFLAQESQTIHDLRVVGNQFSLPLKAELEFSQNGLLVKFHGHLFKARLNIE